MKPWQPNPFGRWITAAALMFLPAAVASAQTPENLFGEVIDVRVINIEVVVTERGDRVSGLGAEDFSLLVDGSEVPIEYFTEVSGGTSIVKSDRAAAMGTVPALAPGKPLGTSYLVFIDDFFMVSARRDRVLSSLIEQLPLMTPEDRMAVVAFDGKKLDMLSTWSQSVDALTRVFERARGRPAHGSRRFNHRRLFLPDSAVEVERASRLEEFERPDLLGAGVRVGSDLTTLEEEQLIELLTEDVERVVMAAASTLRSFASPPGRKVMLLLSGGWPSTPAARVVNDPERAIYIASFPHGEKLYGRLTETANRLSYTLYPIDVPFQADAAAEVDQTEVTPAVTRISDDISDQRATLRRLARDTGGAPIFAGDALKALEHVVADTRSFYWIGFTPNWKGDDRAHKIDVKVRRRGLKLRSRQSFSDLSRQTEVTMMVESALRLGDTPTMTPMPARVGKISKAGRQKVEVPVQVLVPMAALTFLPHQDHYVAQAELRVAVQDSEGTLADIPVVPLRITLDDPPKAGDLRRFETRMTLRKQKHDVVVSIYDNASGTILSTKLQVDPL